MIDSRQDRDMVLGLIDEALDALRAAPPALNVASTALQGAQELLDRAASRDNEASPQTENGGPAPQHSFHLDIITVDGPEHLTVLGRDVADAIHTLRCDTGRAFVVLQAIPDGGVVEAGRVLCTPTRTALAGNLKPTAIALLGRRVRFAHQPQGPTHSVEAIDGSGLVILAGMSGAFAPHLFTIVEDGNPAPVVRSPQESNGGEAG